MIHSRHKCPKHNVPLIKRKVEYGGMLSFNLDEKSGKFEEVIPMGCCVPMKRKRYGFVCPVDKEVYFLQNRKLVSHKELHEDFG